jgi:hypothetical protein
MQKINASVVQRNDNFQSLIEDYVTKIPVSADHYYLEPGELPLISQSEALGDYRREREADSYSPTTNVGKLLQHMFEATDKVTREGTKAIYEELFELSPRNLSTIGRDGKERVDIASLLGQQRLVDLIEEKHNLTLPLLGKRGSGKTLSLRYFFSKNLDSLRAAGFSWVRTDVSRAIDLIETGKLRVDKYALWAHHISHSLFVMFKQETVGNSAEVLGELLPELAVVQGWQKYCGGDSNLATDLHTLYKKARVDFETIPKAIGHAPTEYVRRTVPAMINERDHWERIFRLLTERKAEEFSKRTGKEAFLVTVIDGIDNVHHYDHTVLYESLLDELKVFFASREWSGGVRGMCIVAMRNDTYSDFKLRHRATREGLTLLNPSI